MARETKTVQCYPSDEKINRTCERYGAFGWELIGNQRCSEESGTFGGYKQTTTYNKLTFTREKASPWYNEVVALETEYESIMNSEPCNHANKTARFLGIGCCVLGIGLLFVSIAAFVLLYVLNGAISIIPIPLIVVGVIFIVIFAVTNKRYNRACSEYNSRLSEWENSSGVKAVELLKKSEALVNGN